MKIKGHKNFSWVNILLLHIWFITILPLVKGSKTEDTEKPKGIRLLLIEIHEMRI